MAFYPCLKVQLVHGTAGYNECISDYADLLGEECYYSNRYQLQSKTVHVASKESHV